MCTHVYEIVYAARGGNGIQGHVYPCVAASLPPATEAIRRLTLHVSAENAKLEG